MGNPVSPIDLDTVLVTAELARRSSRAPDHPRECRTLNRLSEAIARAPQTILQDLVEETLQLVGAESAGVSLLTDDGTAFRWPAIAGAWQRHIGNGLPRDASPCGVAIELGDPQLFQRPDRYFPRSADPDHPLEEVLLTALIVSGKRVGTLWAVLHRVERQFDAEDARLLDSVGRFASGAYQLLTSLNAQSAQAATLQATINRDQFLLSLDEATRALAEPEAVVSTAMRLLANHLAADRAVYIEVDSDQDGATIIGEHSPHQPSVLGRYRFSDFGQAMYVGFIEGRTFAFDDVDNVDLTPDERARYVRHQVRAMIQTPLHKGGRLRATVAVYHSTPRTWHAHEVEAAQVVANRCWEAVERARVSRELHASEARLEQLANSLPLVTWECDADGSVRWFNHRFIDLCGAPVSDNLGWAWAAVVDPRDLPAYRAGWEQAVREVKPYAGEARIRDRRGEFRWFLLRTAPVIDSQGRALCWYGGATDIDELKHAQDSLVQTQAQLVQADRRKDEFLATLAHELRNPLAPLHNALEILKLGTGKLDPRLREMMQRQVHHLSRLVNDLLDASRITRGVVELRKEHLRIGDVLLNAVETSRPLIEAKQHQLIIHTPAEPLWLDADPVRLTQVFSNLLNNAARYTPERGHIEIKVRAEAGFVITNVKDSGIGIAPSMIDRVFELFAQGDRESAPAQGGLGIGLYLSRSLVQMHQGRLDVKSAGPGRGSTFTVRVPLAARIDAPDSVEAEKSVMPNLQGHDVVVVDDNADARESLGLLLQHLGARVRMFGDGASALDGLNNVPAAVAFIDVGMPGMDGYTLARRIRQSNSANAPVLVAVTGWGHLEDRARSREAGFDRHLVKPAEVHDIQAILEALNTH